MTAGNASQISDGAAACVVASEAAVERFGLEPLAEIAGYGMTRRSVRLAAHGPRDRPGACDEAGVDPVGELDVIEINEAFASVAVHATRMLGVDDDLVNPNGGAVALGHPIGMSGARITIAAAYELGAARRRRTAAAAICGGGGQGDALVLRRT